MLKWLNIGLRADNSQLKKDFSDAAGVVETSSKKLADAAVAGGSKVEAAQAKAAKATQTLAQQYRAVDKDAQRLAETQGLSSQAFVLAAQKAGELKDRLGEVRAVTNAFSSDTPIIASTIPVMQGLAGAFATAQGAAALFGKEGEAIGETLLKVQATMAIVQGLQAVGQLEDAFTAFSAVLQTKVLPSLLTVNAALMASGIGLAIAAYMVITQAVDNYNDKIEREIALEKELIEVKKLDAEATTTAADNILRSEDLRIRAMADGLEKQKAIITNKERQEKLKEKQDFDRSNKTIYDTNRYNENILNIEKYYNNERIKLNKDFSAQQKKLAENRAVPKVNKPTVRLEEHDPLSGFFPSKSQLDAAIIKQENFQNQSVVSALAYKEKMMQLTKDINQTIEAGIEATVGGMAAAIGAGLAEGASVSEMAAASLLGGIGSMATQLGQLAIATGITIGAIKKALQSLNPAVAIGAGIALVALGAFVSSKARAIGSGGSSGGGGGDYSGGFSGPRGGGFQPYGFQASSTLIQLDGVVRGNNMIIAISNTDRMNKRT